ncbi:MAG: glycosyltransferase family 39 protein, partial [archaeon]
CDALIDFIAFLITLFVPGYLLIEKHFSGLEKWALSVFLSLSVTSFLFYAVISFFGISREFIYAYALILLVLFFVVKKPTFSGILNSIKKIKLNSVKIQRKNLPDLFILFVLVFSLSLTAFFIPINKALVHDDETYHFPIITDFADDGKKTFFSETTNIYEVRSNEFPLLFESFAGVTKFFLEDDFFWFVSFFSLILSLFLIFFISKLAGYSEFFSAALYGLTPLVLAFVRYFTVETFISMFFLGAVFFVLKYFEDNTDFFVLIAGFLSGLMFLTKFTGAIFFVGLFLFLLYKRKFKAAVFFGLLFILVSLTFVVFHFGVPVEQVSVGSYGGFAGNLMQMPSNILKLFEVFFWFFSNNWYIFFIPLLFLIGLFWRKKEEKTFSVLFFISFLFFIFFITINNVSSSMTGLPRYFLPVYSLLCIFSGTQLKKIVLLKNKLFLILSYLIFILLILLTVISVIEIFLVESNQTHNYSYIEGIDDAEGVSVWFVDGGALKTRFNKATLYDYSWQTDFSGNPCDFLKKNKIDYVVYFHFPVESSYTVYLGNFKGKLRKSLLNGECDELVPNDYFEIFKIK